MTPLQKIILITIVLGILVTIFYALVVKFYYWGGRGKRLPPAGGKRRGNAENNQANHAPPTE